MQHPAPHATPSNAPSDAGTLPTGAPAPQSGDVAGITAALRDDRSLSHMAAMAGRLVQLSANEPHPRVRAALLDRAAVLVADEDPARALGLWREAFRLFPDARAGNRLLTLASEDAGFARLGRLGTLVDAIVDLSDSTRRLDALMQAAQVHIQQGHGSSAQRTLLRLADISTNDTEVLELLEVAEQQIVSRKEALEQMRLELANASESERGGLLLGYADMLLHGDEPLADAAAVLADAMSAGVPPSEVAPQWVEVARAMGDSAELTRALCAAVRVEDSPHRLQYADELAGIAGAELEDPGALALALRLLAESAPEDSLLTARAKVAEALAVGVGAEAALEALRLRAAAEKDRTLESAACLALAQAAAAAGQLEAAERHFRRVRSLSPHSTEALDFFEERFRASADHRRLFAALTQRASQSEGQTLIRIALEMAQLAEGPLATQEPETASDRAIEAYRRVLGVQQDHLDAIAGLERQLSAAARWAELAALLTRCAHVFAPRAALHASDRDFVMALWKRVAALYASPDRLDAPDKALEAWQEVLELDARQPDALAAVVAAQTQAQDWSGMHEVLLQAVEAAEDPHELAALSQQLGELLRDHLDDPEAAAVWLSRAATSEPERAEAREQALSLWRSRGDKAPLLGALVAELAARWQQAPLETDPTDVPALTGAGERDSTLSILREGAILAHDLGQLDLSATLWAHLLALEPGEQSALEALHGLWSGSSAERLVASLRHQAENPLISQERRMAVLGRLGLLLLDLHAHPDVLEVAASLEEAEPGSALAQTLRLKTLVATGDLIQLRANFGQDLDGATAYASALAAMGQDRHGIAKATLLQAAATALSAVGAQAQAAEMLADALGAVEAVADASPDQIVSAAQALLVAAQAAELRGLERLAIEALATHGAAQDAAKYKREQTAFLARAELWSEAAAAATEWIEELLASGQWAGISEAVVELDEAARRAGERELLPHRLMQWAEVIPADSEDARVARLKLWMSAAERLMSAGVDLDAARLASDLASEAAPDDPEVLSLREQICTEQSDWPAVVATLERLAELQTGEVQADTLLRAANLCDHALQDPASAAQLYRAVLGQTPESMEAWEGLASALRRVGTVHERADVLDALLARDDLDREPRARLALERVDLATQRDEPEPASAVMACLARLVASLDHAPAVALVLTPSEDEVLAVGMRRLTVTAEAEGVAHLLLPLLRVLGREAELLAALDQDAVDLETRRQIAEVALAIHPTDLRWLAAAAQWAAQASDVPSQLAMTARLADAEVDPAARLALHRECAHLAESVGSTAQAIAAWGAVLEGGDAAARLDAAANLADLCGRVEDFAGQAEALDVLRLATTEGEERTALTLQVTEAWTAAADPDRALAVLRAERLTAPEDPKLLSSILALLGDGAEKTATLAQGWRDAAQDTAQRTVWAEAWLAARWSDDETGNLESVLDVLDAGISGGTAVEKLESLTGSADATVAEMASDRWVQVSAGQGDPSDGLAALLRPRRGQTPLAALEQARPFAAEHGLAEAWLEAAQALLADAELESADLLTLAQGVTTLAPEDPRALPFWEAVWDAEPENEAAQEHVLHLGRVVNDPSHLAQVVERAMLLGRGDRAPLRVELAALKLRLGRGAESLHLLQEVASTEPGNLGLAPIAEQLVKDVTLADEALDLLERVYRQQGELSLLAQVLGKRLDRAKRRTQRLAISSQLVEVHSADGNVEAAVASQLGVLRAEATVEGLVSLERLCANGGHEMALQMGYDLVLALDLPTAQLLPVAQRALALDLSRHDQPAAEARLQRLVRRHPDDDAIFALLADLLGDPDRRPELLEAWQMRLAAGVHPSRRRECLREIAALARASGDVDSAIAAAQEWADSEPDDVDAVEVVVDLLREVNRPQELMAALVALAQTMESGPDRSRTLVEVARIQEGLGDLEGQVAAYESAFDADPTNDEAFVFLERKAGIEPGKLIPLMARRSEALPAGPSRTLILRKLATASAELNDGATACRALETALADDATNVVVLDELLRVAEQQHEWDTWLTAAERRLELETRKEGKAALRRQMARVALTEKADHAAAATHIAALEKLTPGDAAVVQLRTMLQAHSADPREAAAGLEALLSQTTDVATQISLHQQLADLYAGALDNPGKAIRELVRLVQLDPRRWTTRRALCDLYKSRGSMEAYAESVRQWLATLGDSRDSATLSAERIAQLGALQLELGEALAAVGQVNEAAASLKDALTIVGHSPRLDAILAQMLEATSDTQGAAELEDWLMHHHAQGDREQLAKHALKAGNLWEQLGQHQKAREAFKRVLEVRPDDARAILGQGRASLEMGDTDRALRLFDTVSRNVKAPPALRADALVGMGRCRMSRLALDQARSCYERALQLVPGHRGALDGLSEL